MGKRLNEMSEDELLLKKKRKITKRLFGDQAQDLLEKMYKYFPNLEEHIKECRKKNYEQVKKAKEKSKHKRAIAKMVMVEPQEKNDRETKEEIIN